jgi:Ala-tRNA(Pro) deacylase
LPDPTSIAERWTPERLFADLARLGIAYEKIGHPALHTVEEAREHWAALDGEPAKNLFLKDVSGRLWLVLAPAEQPVDLKALRGCIGSKRLSFAGPAELEATLGVVPGAVTPLAVVNDRAGRVSVVVDASLAAAGRVKVHPLVNTATIALAGADTVRFLAEHHHSPLVLALAG